MDHTTANKEFKQHRNRVLATLNGKQNRALPLRRNETRSSVRNRSSSPSGPNTPRLREALQSQSGVCPYSSHFCKGEPSSKSSPKLSSASAASSNMPGGWPLEYADSSSQTWSNLDSQRHSVWRPLPYDKAIVPGVVPPSLAEQALEDPDVAVRPVRQNLGAIDRTVRTQAARPSGTCLRFETAISGALPPHIRHVTSHPNYSAAEDLSRHHQTAIAPPPISRDRDGDIIITESGDSATSIAEKPAHPVAMRRKVQAAFSKPCVSARQNSVSMSFEPLTKNNSILPAPMATVDEFPVLAQENQSKEDELSEANWSGKPRQKVRFASLPKPSLPTSRPASLPSTPALASHPDIYGFQYGHDSIEVALRQRGRNKPSVASFAAYEACKGPEEALAAPELPRTPTIPSLSLSSSHHDPRSDSPYTLAGQPAIKNSPTREHAARVIAGRVGRSYRLSAFDTKPVVEHTGRIQTDLARSQADLSYPWSDSSSLSHISASPNSERLRPTFSCSYCGAVIILPEPEPHRCSSMASYMTDHIPYTPFRHAGSVPVASLPAPPPSSHEKSSQACEVAHQQFHNKGNEVPVVEKECHTLLSKKQAEQEKLEEEERVKATREKVETDQKKKENALPRVSDALDPFLSRKMQTPWERRDAFSVPSNDVDADAVTILASRIKRKGAPKEDSELAEGGVRLTKDTPSQHSLTKPISIPAPTPTKTPSTPAPASAQIDLPMRVKAPTPEKKQDATRTTTSRPTNNNSNLHAPPFPRPTPVPASNTTSPPPPPRNNSSLYAPTQPRAAPHRTLPQYAAVQPPKTQPQVDAMAKPEVIAKRELEDIPPSPTPTPSTNIEDEDWMQVNEETDTREEWEIVE